MESSEGSAGHNVDADIRALIILHTAMLVGQVMFCAIASFMVFHVRMPKAIDDMQPMRIGLAVLAIAAMAGSQMLHLGARWPV